MSNFAPKTHKPDKTNQDNNSSVKIQSETVGFDQNLSLTDPENIAYLQRTIGNHATINLIQRNGGATTATATTTGVWDLDTFKSQTSGEYVYGLNGIMNTVGGRSAELTQIESLLTEYHSAPPSTFDEMLNGISLLKQMDELAREYQENQQGVTSPTVTAMATFRTSVATSKTDLTDKARQAEPSKMNDITTAGDDKVTELKTRFEGSATSLFDYLGSMIELAVPGAGEGKVEIEFSLPVIGYGVFKGHLQAEVEREKDGKVKISSLIGLVAEGGLEKIIKGKLEGGRILESEAPTIQKATTLLSYAYYRSYRESKVVPREIANVV